MLRRILKWFYSSCLQYWKANWDEPAWVDEWFLLQPFVLLMGYHRCPLLIEYHRLLLCLCIVSRTHISFLTWRVSDLATWNGKFEKNILYANILHWQNTPALKFNCIWCLNDAKINENFGILWIQNSHVQIVFSNLLLPVRHFITLKLYGHSGCGHISINGNAINRFLSIPTRLRAWRIAVGKFENTFLYEHFALKKLCLHMYEF